jgi:hypothetical protein
VIALGLIGLLATAWPLLLLGGAALFFMRGRKRGVADTTNRLESGLGVIRERTIAVGDTVLAVNNIGSIAILRGQQSFVLLIIGALLVLVGLITLQSNAGMGLLIGAIGVVLIVINLSQKPDNGLSIGTCDGRITVIVSTDDGFLGDMLDFIRRKVDTGDIKLQGRFDIGARHFNSEGGGIVIGDHGTAGGAGATVRPDA